KGKSRIFLNDCVISQGFLRQLAPLLLEFHGQFSQLWESSAYAPLLDKFGGIAVQEVAQRFSQWTSTQQLLAALEQQEAQQKKEASFLTQALEDFDKIHPEEGEEGRLAQERILLKNKQASLDTIKQLRLLFEERTQEAFRQAQRILAREKSPFFTDLLPSLEQAWAAIDAIITPLDAQERALRQADRTLEEVEERLFLLRDLARRHNVMPEMLPAFWKELQNRATQTSHIAEKVVAQRIRCTAAATAYTAAAERISAQRHQVAATLSVSVNRYLKDLRLEGAEFRVEVTPAPAPGPKGQDIVTFLVRTNPQGPLRPLAQGGSGGELARFSLALYATLAQALDIRTVIFDEIDTGTGGAIASAIGAKLRALAEKSLQVLTITHSPQVTAQAHHHISVRKKTEAQRTQSFVEPLAPEKAIEALAQMLSAEKVTEAARQVARNLASNL
ncbi:MAG: hypothetical protein LBF76_02750, partial [Holosporales bacterium]|nr:hypothetical protein [Holosporales bacterium]